MMLESLHPDCPDWRRLGPTDADAALRAAAAAVTADRESRDELWSRGFTRRRLLAGGLGVGVAALVDQLVSTRVSFADVGAPDTGTLVVMFLRGGMDGLSVVVPADDLNLLSARPNIAVRASSLIPLDRGFGLHPAFASLQSLISANQIAAVPAISTPAITRSHFQAQDCLERGGSGASTSSGWLDRVLEQTGPGTTFRSVGVGSRLPTSLAGDADPVGMSALDSLKLSVPDSILPATRSALQALYTGMDDPVAVETGIALAASATATTLAAGAAKPTLRGYPADSGLSRDLATVSSLITGKTGLRVATIDVGGWDMHTDIGTVDRGDMATLLGGVTRSLAAFFADLGPAASTTTVVMMSEFGRRVEQNANSGADHGHGGVALALGGGVKGGLKGTWGGLSPAALASGDVPGANDYRDFLGEVVMSRLGLSAGQLGAVFPDWKLSRLGVMA